MKREIRPYQKDALTSVSLGLQGGQNRLLWKMPTGTGKTFTFAQLLKELEPWLAQFHANDRKMLIIAHREELLDQAAATIQDQNPGLMVMVEQADRRASRFADVIVASIQTLSARGFARLKNLQHGFTPRVVVVDECHHAAAATYRTALAHLGFLPPVEITDTENTESASQDDVVEMRKALAGWDLRAPKDRVLLGVTATPNRSDAVGLGCVFQSIAYSYDLKKAIDDNWLVPIVPWAIETKTSLDDVHLARGDFNQKELAQAVNNEKRNLLALVAWKDKAQGAATIGFTVDVAHAHAMQELFEKDGIRSAAVSGETPKEDRRQMLRGFTEGQIDVLFNCMVLTEGTDLPRTGCILHLKPTKSATLYEQMTGRGLRLHPGKEFCTVIDLVDVARRHSLQAAPVLYGLPPSLDPKGKKLSAVEDEFNRFMELNPGIDVDDLLAGRHLTIEQLGMVASKVNIWDIPTLGDFGQGRAVQWIKLNDGCYRVNYPWADGSETLELVRDMIGKWEIVLTMRPVDRIAPKRQRTIGTQIPTEVRAAEIAEQFINADRSSVMKLKGQNAPWMQRPASENQRSFMKKMGIPPHIVTKKGLTMGEASQMIDLAKARKSAVR